jgi:hypothetical protein
VLSRWLSIASSTGKRAQFFASLAAMRIAPVTHVDQALGRCFGKRPWRAFAAPEERWYRIVSMEFAQSRGCRSAPIPSWLTTQAMRNR